MPEDRSAAASASDTVRAPATERTALLGDARSTASSDDSEAPDDPVLKEASTRELILILGSIWLGVFLAALGMIISLLHGSS